MDKNDTLFVQVDDVFETAFAQYMTFLDTFSSLLPVDVEDDGGTTCA